MTELNISLFGMFESDQFCIMQFFTITESLHGKISGDSVEVNIFWDFLATFWTDYVELHEN